MSQNSVLTNRLARSGLICAWSIALWAGCHDTAPVLPEGQIVEHLRLAIKPSLTDIKAGQFLDVDLAIVNTDGSPIELCRGDGAAAHLWGIDSKYIKLLSYQVGDHPRCTSMFTLLPDASLHWNARFRVPATPTGPTKLMIAVQVINPKRCKGGQGCDDFWLTGSFEPLTVLSGQ
jgi:hypothetical protein